MCLVAEFGGTDRSFQLKKPVDKKKEKEEVKEQLEMELVRARGGGDSL